MTQLFDGRVRIPGDVDPGLDAVLKLDRGTITITTGGEVLGSWGGNHVRVLPEGDGDFLMSLAGEDLYFTPDSPADFASAVVVPLQPERSEHAKPAETRAPADESDEPSVMLPSALATDGSDDIVTQRLMTGIVVVATILVLAAIGVVILL